MIDRYNCESRFGDWTIDPQGEWVQYDEAQARIAEIEAALEYIAEHAGQTGFKQTATHENETLIGDFARAALRGGA
jgi:transaldolase